MITYGKELKSKKKFSLSDLYSQKECGEYKLILLPKTETLTLEYYIRECNLNNAIVKEQDTFYTIIVGRLNNKSDGFSFPIDYNSKMLIIKNKEISKLNRICSLCKHKLKGIMGECKEKNRYGNIISKCCYDFQSLPETTIDLSNKYFIKINNLNLDSPFFVRMNEYYYNRCDNKEYLIDRTKFTMEQININKGKYRLKCKTGKLKKEKIKNFCSKCVFSCESRLINTSNVNKKCCLPYEQAVKSGFFKDLTLLNSTSIYRQGGYLKNKCLPEKVARFSQRSTSIALTENKYNTGVSDEK